MSNFSEINPIGNEENSISNKKSNKIYVGEFQGGKYVSKVINAKKDYDTKIQISPKIELRLTYILNKEQITGVKITKCGGRKQESINLSTLGFKKILALLKVFSEIDIDSIANQSLILNDRIIKDQDKLKKFLKTVEKDEKGKEILLELIENANILEGEDIKQLANKKKVISQFEKLLNNKDFFKKVKDKNKIRKNEEVWQKFFEKHSWLFGSDVIERLDDRIIDPENISDFLTKNYNGFVDIAELKLPKEHFWTKSNNPRSNLIQALMQCMEYITELERKMNDAKFLKKMDAEILKPRITLVFGRSNSWSPKEKNNFRILNSSFHNITILTYDQVLERAKNIINNK